MVSGVIPCSHKEKLNGLAAVGEEIMLLLRISSGVDVELISQKYGVCIDEVYGESISFLINEGLIDREGSYLSLSRKGMLLASSVSAEFLKPA